MSDREDLPPIDGGVTNAKLVHSEPKRFQAANDNLPIIDDLPDCLPVTDAELDLLEIALGDLLKGIIAANDN